MSEGENKKTIDWSDKFGEWCQSILIIIATTFLAIAVLLFGTFLTIKGIQLIVWELSRVIQ